MRVIEPAAWWMFGLGLAAALLNDPDLIVLDVMLPGLDGFQIVRRMREAGNFTPVLMLTAKSLPEDIVQGLEAGADDYVIKPFSPRELVARVKAVLRRTQATREEATGRLTLDESRLRAGSGGNAQCLGSIGAGQRDRPVTGLDCRLIARRVDVGAVRAGRHQK